MSMNRTAVLNGEPIPANGIRLDDLGWDHRREHGDASLSVNLDEDDLRYVGRRVMEHLREILDEDPEYFDDEGAEGDPVPTSEEIFIEHPEELYRYLAQSIVWSRDTVIAILDRIAPERKSGPILCLLVELREVRAGERSAELVFGVR